VGYEEQPKHAQQFEQAIATAFTCRTVIKYNSTLREEQKNEILAELDATLQFLQDRLIANASIEANAIMPPLQLAEILALSVEDEDNEMAVAAKSTPQEVQELSEQQIRSLYKLYHTYLNTQPGKGMNALETRYKIAMNTLDDVQAALRQQRDTSAQENTEQPIYRIQGFVTALYSMFHEFAAILANVLEGKNIMAETDELTSLQKYVTREIQQQYMLRDITPLMRIYGIHLQLKQRKGSIDNLVSDAIAFLIFLEELLEPGSPRWPEIVEQLRSVAELLQDLSSLLSNYEQALSTVLTLEA